MAKKLLKKTPKQKAARRASTKARRQRTQALVKSALVAPGEFGSTFVPTAPPISTRVPFFASQLKDVCRTTQVGAKCKTARGAKVTRGDLGLDRSGSAEELQAACEAAGHRFEKGRTKPIRAGKMEIDFISPAQAAQLGTRPGPNLRLCARDDKKGYLVPVATPDDAVKLARDFGDCVKNKKANMPGCAAKWALKTWAPNAAPLGSLVAGGRLLGGLFGGR